MMSAPAVDPDDLQIIASIVTQLAPKTGTQELLFEEAAARQSPEDREGDLADDDGQRLVGSSYEPSDESESAEVQVDVTGAEDSSGADDGSRPERDSAAMRKPAGKTARALPNPEDAPWHYSSDLSRWSRGFADVRAAKLHARAVGFTVVWLGCVQMIEVDPRLVATHIVDALGYQVPVTEAQRTRIGKAMTTIVSKVLGPPHRIGADHVVDLLREAPASFDEMDLARTRGDYHEQPVLLARDISRIAGCAFDPLVPLAGKYSADLLLSVVRAMVSGPDGMQPGARPSAVSSASVGDDA